MRLGFVFPIDFHGHELTGEILMKGVQCLVDDNGNKTAVLIDLKMHADHWEDFYDLALASTGKSDIESTPTHKSFGRRFGSRRTECRSSIRLVQSRRAAVVALPNPTDLCKFPNRRCQGGPGGRPQANRWSTIPRY